MAKINPGANVTASERKLANTFPGSSVSSSDMFGANITAAERKFRKKKSPVYKRIKKRSVR